MNILIITTSFPCKIINAIGGSFIHNEALAYAINGANVKVITPIIKGAPREEIIDYGVKVIRFRYFWPDNYQKIVTPGNSIYQSKHFFLKCLNAPFFGLAFLWNILKNSKDTDIIHCQWTTSALFAMPAKWIRKCKLVITARGSDIRLMPVWLNRYIFRKADAAIDCYGPQKWNDEMKMIFPSNYITLPLISKPFSNSSIPEDLKYIFSERQQHVKMVFLGRLERIKIDMGNLPILLLIDAVFELKNKGYKILLVYIGSGDENLMQEMKTRIFELQLEDEVFLIGTRSEPIKYIQHFDIGIGGDVLNAVSQEFAISRVPQVHVKYNKLNSGSIWTDKLNVLFFEPNNLNNLLYILQFAIENQDKMEEIKSEAYNFIKRFVAFPEEGGKLYLNAFSNLM